MNINAVNQLNKSYTSFSGKKAKNTNKETKIKKKHNIAPKVLLTAGAFAAGAAVGIIAYKKLPKDKITNFVKEKTNKIKNKFQSLNKKFTYNTDKAAGETANAIKTSSYINPQYYYKNPEPANLPEPVVKRLQNGIVIKETSSYIPLVGQKSVSEITPPVNNVAKMHLQKDVSGKITKLTTFDAAGNELKNSSIYYNYMAGGIPSEVEIQDAVKGYKHFEYNYNKGGNISSITITDEHGNETINMVKRNFGEFLADASKKLRGFFF